MNSITFNSSSDVMRAARQMVDDAGEGEYVKDKLRTAAKRLGIPYGLAKRIRNNEIKEPKTHVFLRMAERYGEVLKGLEQQSSINTALYRERLKAWGTNETAAADGSTDPSVDR